MGLGWGKGWGKVRETETVKGEVRETVKDEVRVRGTG
jgi:hypothetical protein